MGDHTDGTVRIEHRRLRSAIEFAVAIAQAGQRLRPPIAFPVELKPHLNTPRIPGGALGGLRRAIEADDDFRRRLSAGAVPELVDEIGREWLVREPGWQQRIGRLIDENDREVAAADAAGALRRAEKRREAAEQATARTRAELIGLREQLGEVRRQLDQAQAEIAVGVTAVDERRQEVATARTAARHAEDRARAAEERRRAAEAEAVGLRAERDQLAAQRDVLLAERAERAGLDVAATDMAELRRMADSARRLADQLTALVTTPGAPPRRPLTLPGGVARDSRRATETLLRAGGLVLVDGYNVTMLAWPDTPLVEQRSRLLDLADDVARRFGTDLAVVFDGADVIGAHGPRRLVRVRYSPSGVTADDVIRAEVAAVPAHRPVVVVTNDGAVRRDVAAAGGNLIASDAFLAVGLGRPDG